MLYQPIFLVIIVPIIFNLQNFDFIFELENLLKIFGHEGLL